MNGWDYARKLVNAAGGIGDPEGRGEVPDGYGLCSKCEYMQYRTTALGDECVSCAYDLEAGRVALPIRPRPTDPIVSCSRFHPRGQMSLSDMAEIATIIDIKKHPIGFTGTEETEIVLSKFKDKEND